MEIIDDFLLKLSNAFERRIANAKRKELLKATKAEVSVGAGFTFDFLKCDFTIKQNASFIAGDNVVFRNYSNIMIYENAKLVLGNNVFFNRYSSINCLGSINIGNDSIFGEGVKLYDHNHKYRGNDVALRLQGYKIGFVTIGRNCWIGSNVTILTNVTIGDDVIIGAGCLIFKDVPSGSIVKANSSLLVNKLETNSN